ncbi:MAG: tRNA guanosine(34) transglycosylase Tgt [Patescibacteria group bacterium]|jgi:queuine tRNA-ribosyltransferase
MFKVLKKSTRTKARLTKLATSHGDIDGPFFMPIATKGAVKNLAADELQNLNAEIILANTYHLMLSPGNSLIKKAGGLHRFMNWPGPILTDSGGFQVFSLANLRKISEAGVEFSDPTSGKKYLLTPELSMQIQKDFGVDIAMAFDDVIGYPAAKQKVKLAMERTTRWAGRCQKSFKTKNQKLFGIIQGGIYKDLRLKSAKEITALEFDGYAIGGVAVGEPREKMREILNWVMPFLPENKPRYLMGLGRPEEIVAAVKQGIDMFDCVIPTREARHGRLYLWSQPSRRHPDHKRSEREGSQRFFGLRPQNDKFYKTINITNAKYKSDFSPINQTNLKQYSKAYLHHLFHTNEPLGMRLATLNNLSFYLTLMSEIRQAIKKGKL